MFSFGRISERYLHCKCIYYMLLSPEIRSEVNQIVYVADRNLVAVEKNRLLLPPTYTRYFTWGFPDHSARISLVEGDRVRGVEGWRDESKGIVIIACVCLCVRMCVVLLCVCFLRVEGRGVAAPRLFLIIAIPVELVLVPFQVTSVFEGLHQGRILCASVADEHTLLTGGDSTVRTC